MDETKNIASLTLYNDKGEALQYEIAEVFALEEGGAMYCLAVPVKGETAIFLKCSLEEKEDGIEITVADIEDAAEYELVMNAYLAGNQAAEAAVEAPGEEIPEGADIISVTDGDGNQVDFVIDAMLEEDVTHRKYVAVRRISEAGQIVGGVTFYRFQQEEDGGEAVISAIPSDMERERVEALYKQWQDGAKGS